VGYHRPLTAEAAAELAAMTLHYWEERENGDLARFVTLKSNGCQYFLYATRLLGKQILTLIYDSNLPFSRIRPNLIPVARSLIAFIPQPAHSRAGRRPPAIPRHPWTI